jgi:ribosome-binding ATPase YchF (GTP1/OBG family)
MPRGMIVTLCSGSASFMSAATSACRVLGKLRTEGKEYVVQDGDVIEFKTYV